MNIDQLRKELEVAHDDLNELMELLGEDKFNKYFEYEVKFSPVKEFYKSLVKTNTVDDLEDIVEQIRYKPTVKVS